MKLYHYTCSHSAVLIRRDMVLKPHTQGQLDGRPLIWLTDLDTPNMAALSLTSVHLRCDRTEWRAVVDVDAHHWPDYVRRQDRAFRAQARALAEEGGMPMHWYVCRFPVPVLDLTEVRP